MSISLRARAGLSLAFVMAVMLGSLAVFKTVQSNEKPSSFTVIAELDSGKAAVQNGYCYGENWNVTNTEQIPYCPWYSNNTCCSIDQSNALGASLEAVAANPRCAEYSFAYLDLLYKFYCTACSPYRANNTSFGDPYVLCESEHAYMEEIMRYETYPLGGDECVMNGNLPFEERFENNEIFEYVDEDTHPNCYKFPRPAETGCLVEFANTFEDPQCAARDAPPDGYTYQPPNPLTPSDEPSPTPTSDASRLEPWFGPWMNSFVLLVQDSIYATDYYIFKNVANAYHYATEMADTSFQDYAYLTESKDIFGVAQLQRQLYWERTKQTLYEMWGDE